MSLVVKQLSVPVASGDPDAQLRPLLAQELGIPEGDITALRILKKSLDARKKSRIVYHYQLNVDCADNAAVLRNCGEKVEPYVARPDYHPMEGISLGNK